MVLKFGPAVKRSSPGAGIATVPSMPRPSLLSVRKMTVPQSKGRLAHAPKIAAMAEMPSPTEPGPDRAESELHRTGVKAWVVLGRLGTHWCLTCCVAAVTFLAGLAWLMVTTGLPRLGIAVPSWINQVAGGLVFGGLVVLVVLSLVPHKEL